MDNTKDGLLNGDNGNVGEKQQDKVVVEPEWESHKRETWTGRLEFILSCIGFCVGLGNVWRFPYLCYRNGGGAFLVPYFLFMFVCAMPLVMLELSIGQFASLSPATLFKRFCPLFQGVGWSMTVVLAIVCVYYNVIITWALYYLYLSLTTTLPWMSCDNWWNTPGCILAMGTPYNQSINLNQSIFESMDLQNSTIGLDTVVKRTASEEFWRNAVLQISSGIEEMGGVQWELFVALAVAWTIIFVCLSKGVLTSGKAVYVTATAPYVLLVLLLIRGLLLPGAMEGIRFYLVPDWSKLRELSVWQDAASQIFFSACCGWGALVVMASYNKFHHNVYRDAILLPVINCCTSIFAGFVVFSIIGFMAHESGQPISDVITGGPGLVFVVYPEAVTQLPISPFWSVLFFSLILFIGVDSQFGNVETVTSTFIDEFPEYLRARRTPFTFAVCFVMFLAGIPCVMKGGIYVLNLMDWYAGSIVIMVIAVLECVTVAYIYGYKRFVLDIELMTGQTVFMYFPIAWLSITPMVSAGLFVLRFLNVEPVTYGSYAYPVWADVIGWILAIIPIVPIPVLAVYSMINAKGTFRERLSTCLAPTPNWGPSRLEDRIAFQQSFALVPSKQSHVLGVDQGCQFITQEPVDIFCDGEQLQFIN